MYIELATYTIIDVYKQSHTHTLSKYVINMHSSILHLIKYYSSCTTGPTTDRYPYSSTLG